MNTIGEERELPTREGSGQTRGTSEPTPAENLQQKMPTAAKRQALRDLGRQMTDEELSSPGVQKMIIDALEQVDAECERLRRYVELFHGADKRAAVLQEKLRTVAALEIVFGVGVGLGGTIIGLSPLFWDEKAPLKGIVTLIVGAVLMLGAAVARVVKR